MPTITDVEVTPIAVPVEAAVSGSSYAKEQRGTMVVTVSTDEGVVGRTYSGDVTDSSPEKGARLVEFVREHIRPLVVGEPLLSTEAIWERSFARSSRFFAYQPEDRLLYIHAIGAVDIAIWDAIGKTLDVPLYRLWGGYRDSLPIIAIGGYYEENKGTDDLLAEMEEYEEMGLAGVKLKVGGRSVERDLERLQTVREGMGRDFVVACDANQGYSIEEAVAFAETAREYDIKWFEEPVVWHDQYAGMREVRRRTGVPVTAGQSESTASACRRLIEADAVDIINLDASIAGGPTVWRKVAAMADVHNVRMAHHEEPHVAMHLLSSIPNGLYAECFHPAIDPVWYRLIENPPTIADGRLHLPDGPGFGIDLDEGFIEEYAVTLGDQ